MDEKDKIKYEIVEKLSDLKSQRKSVEELVLFMDGVQQEFNDKHKAIIESLSENRGKLGIIEGEIRTMALQEYGITKDKNLTGGLGIRIMKRMEYDSEKALNWANEHKMCLTLDRRAFEKIAKTDQIGFVEFKEEVTATIPKEIKDE